MIPRRLIAALLLPVPVLLVAFAVLMGGSALADAVAGRVLFWTAIAALLLLVIDLILLVLALALRAADPRADDEP
ncbi:MAG TPA: hypothetical protein VMP01_01445 [Pirellulaceae bacterium]|nr:hypothetical protein [Pirellulaceae bacterium]